MNNELVISQEQIIEAKNIAQGVYFPLVGFLRKKDFLTVASKMRLKDGRVWPIPIVLDIDKKDAQRLKEKNRIVLVDENGKSIAFLRKAEIYQYNKDFLAKNVFRTLDKNHPGVREIYQMKEYLIGGEVGLIDKSSCFGGSSHLFNKYSFTPKETKKIFREKKWRTVVAFQTRNIPHRSHESLQKQALGQVDGLFIQPVIGKKKIGDFKDEIILKSYETLISNYYPKDRVHLGILSLKMRYAGPREAVLHALIRKNYGCTHIIIGRDHAGVGDYYGPYEAQEIFSKFKPEEIGINILKYDNFIYCRLCHELVSQKVCPHSDQDKMFLSGTKMREMIKSKQALPKELIRLEVADLLSNYSNQFVEE